MIYTAIMGHGVVGSGVAEIMINSKKHLSEKIYEDIEVKYILDLRDFDNLSYSEKFTKDFNDILNDNDIKIVVEVMGGVNPAFDFVKKCLLAGKSVVTSNKELVAVKGAELIKIAKENDVNFLFEASVGGGIPVLRPLIQCLSANKIEEIYGILNGTTNYILNKMIVDKMDFSDALKLAQDNGFAEKNPSADIDGFDAARKICILATLAFGKHVYPEQVKTSGITNISLDDIDYAKKLGGVIKLIGSAKRVGEDNIAVEVAPTFVRNNKLISHVDGVFNAVAVVGDAVGEVMFYGQGAGKMATASAVVADVLDCAKHLNCRKYLDWEDGKEDYVVESNDKTVFFVVGHSSDYDKTLKAFENEFSNVNQSVKNEASSELAFLTCTEDKKVLTEKINSLGFDNIKIFNSLL